jgi:hypothetical protein
MTASLNRATGRAVATYLVTAAAGTPQRAAQVMDARVLLDMLGVIDGPGGRDVLPDGASFFNLPPLKSGTGNTDGPPVRRAQAAEPDDVAPRHTVPAGLRDLTPAAPARPAAPKPTHSQETPVSAPPMLDVIDPSTGSTYVTALRARDLFVDDTYQRPLDQARVNRMAKAWDPRQLGVLDVSDRGPDAVERYAIVNGQHRCAAALKAAAYSADVWVPCTVHEGLDPAGEAQLMYELDRGTKALTSWDKWRARSAAGDPVVVGVETVARAHGMKVHPGSFGAVGAAEKLWRAGGEELLDAAVAVLVAAWGTTSEAVSAPLLTGAGTVLRANGAAVHIPRLVQALQKTTPGQMRAQANALRQVDGGSLHAIVARSIVSHYNRVPAPGPRLAVGGR